MKTRRDEAYFVCVSTSPQENYNINGGLWRNNSEIQNTKNCVVPRGHQKNLAHLSEKKNLRIL